MSIFQWLADRIESFKTPAWYKTLMGILQDIMIQVLISVGKEYIQKIEVKILEVKPMDMSNTAKFNAVFKYGKSLLPTIKDSSLNLLIEFLYKKLKEEIAK